MTNFMKFISEIENTLINEMPKIFTSELNPRYIDKNILIPLDKATKEKTIFDTGIKVGDKHLAVVATSKFNNIYAVGDENGFIGATSVDIFNADKKSYYKIKITKKFRDRMENFLIDTYIGISKDLNNYIFTDDTQSVASSKMWKKMVSNPKKYNIDVKILKSFKEIEMDLEDIWGYEDNYMNVLVGIKYKGN